VRWDAVVVGAGPAGSATAARLAARGWRVLLLDRAEFPRRKACGECVNPAGVAALARLGALERVLALAPARLEGWRIHAGEARAFTGRFPPGVHGLAVPRERLDAALLDHARAAGAVARTGVRVSDLLRGRGGWVEGVVAGGEEVEARVVVGADGLRSVVLRRLGLLLRPPRLRKLALTAHLRGASLPSGLGELRVRGRRCLGLAAVGGGAVNAVVVVPAAEAGEVGGDAEAFFDRALREHGVAGERATGVLATGPFDFPVRRAAAAGAVLVGDAAGYYDPFTGQGIFRALRGAELAAGVLDAALRGGEITAASLAPYERARRRAFAAGERMQRLVEAVVSRPWLMRPVAARLAARPVVADALVQVVGDVRGPGALLSPRVVAGFLA
jgi:menaquinone-9 beta-reductase